MTSPQSVAVKLTEAQRRTCETCNGKGYWQSRRGGEKWPCRWCVVDEPRVLDLILHRLSDEQKMFLLLGDETLAYQAVTPEQWDGSCCCGFWIEDDDEIDLGDGLTWPATKHWFAASCASYKGDGGDWHLSFKYNANGLALRTFLLEQNRV